MLKRNALTLAISLAFLASTNNSFAATQSPSMEKMWEMILVQQRQIDALMRKNKQLAGQVEVASEMAEKASTAATSTNKGDGNHGGSGRDVSIGGYGELHYNNLDSKNEVDFHRFVLFFGHDFNETTRFFSELELEHSIAGEGKSGEIELEQAYIEHDLNDKHSAKAGLFLIPVGILNETHEPATFYGVERNPVETNIIPSTWWEAGASLNGQIGDGWSYDVAYTSGLETPTTGSKAYKIRDGRKKVAKATANKGAVTGRIKWTGMPGLELGAAVQYQADLTQSKGATGTSSSANMLETHAVYQNGPFAMRALYAQWDLDGTGPAAIGRDKQNGWYIEPSYKINSKLGVFARYNEWDNNAGSGSATDTKTKQTDFGVNYWLHENVVFKFDVQNQSGAANDDGYNLGVGFQY